MEEEGPTELNPINHPRFLEVAKDKLTIRYVGKGSHTHDVGAIQSNRPVPRSVFAYYYELTVLDAGTRGCGARSRTSQARDAGLRCAALARWERARGGDASCARGPLRWEARARAANPRWRAAPLGTRPSPCSRSSHHTAAFIRLAPRRAGALLPGLRRARLI
jgi:hypothetical protein